jgi:hypothetical protein
MTMRVSRGFVSSLAGLAITFYAWFSHSIWPGWPAIVVFDTLDRGRFSELSHAGQAVVTVLLIALNVAVWALAVQIAWWIVRRSASASRRGSP